MRTVLTTILVLLAVAIGVLHFALDFVLFRGNIFVKLPRPPGGGGGPGLPLGLDLPQLFLANLILFVILALLVIAAARAKAGVRIGIDLLLIVAALVTLYGWNNFRRPNPHGLGVWAVSMELALIVFAILHAVTLRRAR